MFIPKLLLPSARVAPRDSRDGKSSQNDPNDIVMLSEQCEIAREIIAACTGSNYAMQVHVLLQPLGGPPIVSIGAGESVQSASTIKTLILLAALRLVERGGLSLTQEIVIASAQILPDSIVFSKTQRAYTGTDALCAAAGQAACLAPPMAQASLVFPKLPKPTALPEVSERSKPPELSKRQGEAPSTVPQHCTLEELLTWMIVCSDNTATNVVIDLLGMEAVNEAAQALGLKSTALRRKMLDFDAIARGLDNTTSAEDQYKMYAALYATEWGTAATTTSAQLAVRTQTRTSATAEGKATACTPPTLFASAHARTATEAPFLSRVLQQKARTILCAQRDNNVLLRNLWQPVRVAHKTGELDTVRHDAGVFETQAPYFLAVLITQAADIAAAEALAGRIGKLVFLAQQSASDVKNTGIVPADIFESDTLKTICSANPTVQSIRPENTPTLETHRLLLRKFTQQDVPALFELLSDTTVNTFLPWQVLETQQQAQDFFEKNFLAYEAAPSAYRYAICLKSDNRPIGYVWMSANDSNDFGYALRQAFWRKGIVAEAARAVLCAIKAAGYAYITATHDVQNPASGAVMKKLGMTYRYSYFEQVQPKNIPVIFRLYQLNFIANAQRTYQKYWNEAAYALIEENI